MMPVNLHIGCGDEIKPGYVNIDEFNPNAELRIPIQAIEYPEDSVDRIEGYMVFEHLSLADARTFLRKANNMLRAGGILILEVPDLEKVCRLILQFADDPRYLETGAFGLRGFFGEPRPGMTMGDYHKWGYTPVYFRRLLEEAGFSRIEIKDGTSHCYPLRDMRIEAIK
jgi:hypothetical protein